MRLFAAIPLSEDARRVVVDVRDHLATFGWPVRWVGDDSIHLTITFFGDVDAERATALGHGIAQAVSGMHPVGLELGGVGVFPNRRKPRVMWLGVDAPPALELLHHEVERAGMMLGFPSAHQTYRPHVTLGRLKRDSALPADATEQLDAVDTTVASMADRVVLFQSHLERGGARHEPVRVIPLEGAWAV